MKMGSSVVPASRSATVPRYGFSIRGPSAVSTRWAWWVDDQQAPVLLQPETGKALLDQPRRHVGVVQPGRLQRRRPGCRSAAGTVHEEADAPGHTMGERWRRPRGRVTGHRPTPARWRPDPPTRQSIGARGRALRPPPSGAAPLHARGRALGHEPGDIHQGVARAVGAHVEPGRVIRGQPAQDVRPQDPLLQPLPVMEAAVVPDGRAADRHQVDHARAAAQASRAADVSAIGSRASSTRSATVTRLTRARSSAEPASTRVEDDHDGPGPARCGASNRRILPVPRRASDRPPVTGVDGSAKARCHAGGGYRLRAAPLGASTARAMLRDAALQSRLGSTGSWTTSMPGRTGRSRSAAPASVLVEPGTRVATIGSCFAAELASMMDVVGIPGAMHPGGLFYSTDHDPPGARAARRRLAGAGGEPLWAVGRPGRPVPRLRHGLSGRSGPARAARTTADAAAGAVFRDAASWSSRSA